MPEDIYTYPGSVNRLRPSHPRVAATGQITGRTAPFSNALARTLSEVLGIPEDEVISRALVLLDITIRARAKGLGLALTADGQEVVQEIVNVLPGDAIAPGVETTTHVGGE